MKPSESNIFSDISYLALNQMDQPSDDERIAETEVRENQEEAEGADDEFSTYFTDQKVPIPIDERVSGKNETLASLEN